MIVLHDGTSNVLKYPYSVTDFIHDNPNISLPRMSTPGMLSAFGLAEVIDTPMPTFNEATHKVIEKVPNYVDGNFIRQREVVALSLTEREELLDRNIKTKCELIDLEAANRLKEYAHNFGGGYGVLHLQLRNEVDRTNWLTLNATVLNLIEAGSGNTPNVLSVRTTENITVPMTANEIVLMLSNMMQYGGLVMYVQWAHKDAVSALTDYNSVSNYNISVGWPNSL